LTELLVSRHGGAHAQDLAPGVVVVRQLTGNRLDLDIGEALSVEQTAGEIEG
jgi:hypothetical protein